MQSEHIVVYFFIRLIIFFQVFLTICTLVTIYFAEEIPLASNNPTRTSGLEHSKSNGTANGIKYERVERDTDVQLGKSNNEHQDETYIDNPGSVLVNLLTSLRQLPPDMHSVLIVMALTWVSTKERITTIYHLCDTVSCS